MTTMTPADPITVTELRVHDGLVRKLLRNPLTDIALVILAIFVVVAIVQPWIMPFPPNLVRLEYTNAPAFTTEFVLGGDKFGRDILSRLIASTRGAMQAAIILTAVSFLIGTTAGLIAGYFGKFVDSISIWLFSVIMSVPGVIVLISLYTLLGTSTAVAMAVFGVLVSPSLFWMVRTLTRDVRNELYVDAAKVSGLSSTRIVGRHVLIAIRAPIILMAAGLAGAGIAVQAGLEFLGLGEPNQPSWGAMLTDAFANIYIAPEQIVWPAIALGLVTGAFSLVSIGLRDVLEGTYVKPSTRSRKRLVQRLLGDAELVISPDEPAVVTRRDTSGIPPLLTVEGLHIAYPSGDQLVPVVNSVSFEIPRGRVVGVVGESGSGKTQTVLAILGLLPDEAIVARGSIRLEGTELLGMSEAQLQPILGSEIGYVPQEPMANLDPSFTVGAQLVFGIRAQTGMSRKNATELAMSMLNRVGIQEPRRVFGSYPHQISGGMAQRVLIAGAVATKPKLLIADEPTTALDVTVQAEVLDLLRELQKDIGMGVIVVTHNFGVVADLCDEVIVMRAGTVVEEGSVVDVFLRPQHPYTRTLLGSVLDNATLRTPLPPNESSNGA